MSAKNKTQAFSKRKHKEIDTQRDKNKRKFWRETIQGDDYNRDKGVMLGIHQEIDRINNSYKKKLTNPKTGEVIIDIKEPLTDHIGHGAAKKKN